jgi:hypothetical protein
MLLKSISQLGIMAHTYNPNNAEVEMKRTAV